ncbi:MAG: sigma-70 family RNA polymerase sigma factor [Patescibacteria group bacterium]
MLANNQLRELLVAYHQKPNTSQLAALATELYPLINKVYTSLHIDYSWNRDQLTSIGHGKLLHLLTNKEILRAQSVRAFVIQSLKNAMLDALKHQHESVGIEDDVRNEMAEIAIPGPDELLADDVANETRLLAAMDALESLPLDRKTMLYLYYFAGWTFQEIADSFGWGRGLKGHTSVHVKRSTQELAEYPGLWSLYHL